MVSMRILSLVNSFKGTASSKDINYTIKKTLSRKFTIEYLSVSDGGDGFLDCFRDGSKSIKLYTIGPLREIKVRAEYLIKGEEAFIEIANVCGIKYLRKDQLNPIKATTYGISKLILDAISNNAKEIYLGLGGTATNEAAAGLAYGLGIRFLDRDNNEIFPDIEGIIKTERLDLSNIRIPKGIRFYAVADVKNRLLGRYGSAKVFAPQKGASERDIKLIETALKKLTYLIKKHRGRDISKVVGGAAAGGIAAGVYGFFDAEILNGSKFIIERLGIDKIIPEFDIIITGEGKFDRTSFYGKITGEIIKLAKRFKKRCIVITAIDEIYREDIEIIDLSKKYPIRKLLKSPLAIIEKEISNYRF